MGRIAHYSFILRQLSKRLSVRAAAFSILAIVVALLGTELSHFVPTEWAQALGGKSVYELLKILASSMLVVVTFSLATMVSAYSTASEGVTPRVTRLLMEDNQSQNTISIFLGAFIFSIVSLVILSTGFYAAEGKFILFVFTVLFIAAIVWTINQWIEALSKLGRVHETIVRIEKKIEKIFVRLAKDPGRGGRTIDEIPNGPKKEVFLKEVGHIQSINAHKLQEFAEKFDLNIYLRVEPGDFILSNQSIAHLVSPHDKLMPQYSQEELQSCFNTGSSRSYDDDPRFGFVTLSEVASRALSPAVNDPGTAIDVISALARLLSRWNQEHLDPKNKIKFDRLYFSKISISKFLEDSIRPIARDGSSHLEVMLSLCKVLQSLESASDPELAKSAKQYKEIALSRAKKNLKFDEDFEFLSKSLRSHASEILNKS